MELYMLERIKGKKAASRSEPVPVENEREQRWQRIAHAAYLRAKERGFAPGHELEDWPEAERKVDVDGGK